jgi:hypothetical protein
MALFSITGAGGDITGNTVSNITINPASTNSLALTIVSATSTAQTTACTYSNNTFGNPNSLSSIVNPNNNANRLDITAFNISPTSTSIDANKTTVSGNYIGGFTNNSTNASNVMRGIVIGNTTSQVRTEILNNKIFNLISAAGNTNSTTTPAISGILNTSTASTLMTIDGNEIANLHGASTSAGVTVVGISQSATTSSRNVITRNRIHSFSSSSAATSTTIQGIHIQNGLLTAANNEIRLGIDSTGSPVSMAYQFEGFRKSASNSLYMYHNSIYIGGTVTPTSAISTAAFRRTASAADSIYNNVLVNVRSNTTTGGKHYVINNFASTTFFSNYNVYFNSGTGSVLATSDGGTTDISTLAALQTSVGLNQNSLIGNPNYSAPAASSSSFSLAPANPTPIEGTGVLIGMVNVDINNNSRSGLTPTDIGAYAGNYTVLDLFPPIIVSLSQLSNTTSTGTQNVTAVITDQGSGINNTSAKPRLWYRNLTISSAWVSSEGSLTSGTNTNGTWSFDLDPSAPGTMHPVLSNQYQYYIAVGDNGGNLVYSPSAGANHTSVSVQVTAPSTPLNFIVQQILSGIYTVGSGGNFSNLTNSGGAFDILNASAIGGNITLSVISDLTESGTVALSALSYVPSNSVYSITVVPNNSTAKTISGNAASGLIRLNGARNVTFNGYVGTAGKLVFRNTSTAAPVFSFTNDAIYNTLSEITIEGASTDANSGLVFFGTSTGTIGNSFNSINGCLVRDLSTTSGIPANLIVSNGSVSPSNARNTIQLNSLKNYTSNAINLINAGPAWVVRGNNVFYDQATSATSSQNGIVVNSSSMDSLIILSNKIGGNAANNAGTWINTGSTATFNGILITAV